jgi:hypothetical protein
VTDAVDARIHADEASFVESFLDPARGDTRREELLPGDHSVLAGRNRGSNPVLTTHTVV